MNPNDENVTDKQWESLLSRLSPSKIASLEKTLKTMQNKCESDEMINNIINNKENDEFDDINFIIKSEPTTSSKSFLYSEKSKNRGLTYENGRRNLKSEQVTFEEKERRAKRRERNRVAAQKCRERRQQQIEELQHQVDILRSTEQQLYSVLKELSNEENELLQKLSKHNCLISENKDGEITFSLKNNSINANAQYPHFAINQPRQMPVVASSYSLSRPSSLSVSQQNYTTNQSTTIDQFISKEESLTPLLSPESYSILKCQIKTENTSTDFQTMDIDAKSRESDLKVAFSWSNSMIEQLSSPFSTEPGSNLNFLTTPIVDLPFYSSDTKLNGDISKASMEWHSSHRI